MNLYGPSEVTVISTSASIPSFRDGSPPIGRPRSRLSTYVLGPDLRPLPIGAGGELHVSGSGLTRGYLRRPQLSAGVLVPNPFAMLPGERLYKTGDLARHQAGGDLEYLGRRDHQVKLRGFRIELGEIEAALSAHPGVLSTAVTLFEDAPGERRLVAYVVPRHPNAPPGSAALREYLRKTLPDFMVPSTWVFPESLPLNPSGKVDRRALPAPGPRVGGEELVEPSTPLEKMVARIWTEVLGVDRVGLADNFFELGGHSLLATQIFARLAEDLEIELPLNLLFNASSLGEFATRVEEGLAREESGRQVLALLDQLEGLSPDEVELLLAGEAEELAAAGETGAPS